MKFHHPTARAADRPLLGIALMVMAMLIIPGLDLCAKLLNQDHHVLQVSWLRFASHLLWMLPFMLYAGGAWWRVPAQLGLQVIRGACLLLATIFFFAAISDNPIPNSLALLFVSPMVVTLLSPLFLRETFGIRRFVATVVGFIGVVIVLQPQAADFQPSILFALLAGVCYAFYIMVTRKLTSQSSPLIMLFYTALIGVLVLLPLMPVVWRPPSEHGWLLVAIMGLVAAGGHFLLIISCRLAPASLVAPFNYTEIIGATLLSYIVFGYLPLAHVWLGIAIIVASGVYISYREIRSK